ncbi:HalOD1 output domain-containing protein [Natranaeroarchaeum sulfidigenes]|uniref:Halobacterial output domain-containing protein n=1 Tax=Natranaeroarchaeum sulfidigenes TaxID=2784880 RepID=A0A897MPQ1_9EURY|nr:HalOD1 output domain-containing protein [Natranaeroarchaeum sulfidigenes]QSG04130.1 Uncharacterized protein AArcS_2943 [Natranaeroarchaeum sulfidigenes]
MAVTVGDAKQDRVVEQRAETVPASTAVIEAIAELESTQPMTLDVTLYDSVDLDALDALCEGSSNIGVSFTADGYAVEISGDTVVVERY